MFSIRSTKLGASVIALTLAIASLFVGANHENTAPAAAATAEVKQHYSQQQRTHSYWLSAFVSGYKHNYRITVINTETGQQLASVPSGQMGDSIHFKQHKSWGTWDTRALTIKLKLANGKIYTQTRDIRSTKSTVAGNFGWHFSKLGEPTSWWSKNR